MMRFLVLTSLFLAASAQAQLSYPVNPRPPVGNVPTQTPHARDYDQDAATWNGPLVAVTTTKRTLR